MAVVTVGKIIEGTLHPFGTGALAVNGIQFGSIYNSTVAGNFTTTGTKAINLIGHEYSVGGKGSLQEIEFGLTAAFQANASTLMEYQWQARNLMPLETTTWQPLCGNEAHDVTTGWSESTMSGRFTVSGNYFNSIPFEIRMQFKTNHANVGIARVNSVSSITYIYRIS